MTGDMHLFTAVLGTMVFAGFIAAYMSHKWDD